MNIAIVDLGIGNCGSISFALNKLNATSLITSDPKCIREADKIILPGVGAFDTVVAAIDNLGLRKTLIECATIVKKPLLGICVGMQVLANTSAEGELQGLGLIPGYCDKFKQNSIKVPHMGWNQLAIIKPSPILKNLPNDSRFYFVHSYYVVPKDSNQILTTSYHGVTFASSVHDQNIFGVQFHPEKSHRYGLIILKNFVEI